MDSSIHPNTFTEPHKRHWWQPWWKYVAILRANIASSLAYANELVFRSLMLIAIVFILSQLWKTTFSIRGTQTLSGFNVSDLIWYLCAAEAIAMSMPPL